MDFFDILLAKKLEDDRDPTIEGLSVTENGTYREEGKAYSPVIVEVPEPTLITKSITANGTYSASEDNADGYSSVTVAVEGFKKKSIANTPTDIASFADGTANPMPSLEISIEPVQSGSGDPSPQNVRPISGWSGANVTKCGKNIFDNIFPEITQTINYRHIKVNNGTYTMSSTCPLNNDNAANIFFIAGYATSGANTAINGVSNGVSRTVTTTDGYITVAYRSTGAQYNPENYNNQIELGSATTYSPYQGSTLSIPFRDSSDNPITVYGGRLNVTSGELTVTHANIASYNGETINEPWISSMDVYSAGTTPTAGAQVVYPLTTPQTYQLTPAQVTTLLNQNNIFADCGQILEGEYFVTL